MQFRRTIYQSHWSFLPWQPRTKLQLKMVGFQFASMFYHVPLYMGRFFYSTMSQNFQRMVHPPASFYVADCRLLLRSTIIDCQSASCHGSFCWMCLSNMADYQMCKGIIWESLSFSLRIRIGNWGTVWVVNCQTLIYIIVMFCSVTTFACENYSTDNRI